MTIELKIGMECVSGWVEFIGCGNTTDEAITHLQDQLSQQKSEVFEHVRDACCHSFKIDGYSVPFEVRMDMNDKLDQVLWKKFIPFWFEE